MGSAEEVPFVHLNRWNDTMGTALEEGATRTGEQPLTTSGWIIGKHAGARV